MYLKVAERDKFSSISLIWAKNCGAVWCVTVPKMETYPNSLGRRGRAWFCCDGWLSSDAYADLWPNKPWQCRLNTVKSKAPCWPGASLVSCSSGRYLRVVTGTRQRWWWFVWICTVRQERSLEENYPKEHHEAHGYRFPRATFSSWSCDNSGKLLLDGVILNLFFILLSFCIFINWSLFFIVFPLCSSAEEFWNCL